jgi:hypothetical protein
VGIVSDAVEEKHGSGSIASPLQIMQTQAARMYELVFRAILHYRALQYHILGFSANYLVRKFS